MCITGSIRKTVPLEQGQLQRALTITSAGYAVPETSDLQRSLTITSAGYAVPQMARVHDKANEISSPEIIIQPAVSNLPSSATTVFPVSQPVGSSLLVGQAFGQIYEA